MQSKKTINFDLEANLGQVGHAQFKLKKGKMKAPGKNRYANNFLKKF